MWSFLVPLSLLAAPAPKPLVDAKDLKEQATQAFRRGELVRACKLFDQVVRAEPRDAPGWADLGLCLAKRGKKKQAIDALDQAISLGDPETRKHAYYNLGKFELRAVGLADLDSEAGADWAKPAGCERSWRIRSGSYNSCGTSYCNSGSGLWVGPKPYVQAQAANEDAAFDITFQQRQVKQCSHDCWRYSSCDPCMTALDRPLLSPEARAKGEQDGLEPLLPRIRACVSQRNKPCLKTLDEDRCQETWGGCIGDACSAVRDPKAKGLSPAELAMLKEKDDCLDSCMRECESGNDKDEPSELEKCRVVSVNPCAQAVGLVCPQGSGGLTAEEEPIEPHPAEPAPDADGGS